MIVDPDFLACVASLGLDGRSRICVIPYTRLDDLVSFATVAFVSVVIFNAVTVLALILRRPQRYDDAIRATQDQAPASVDDLGQKSEALRAPEHRDPVVADHP